LDVLLEATYFRYFFAYVKGELWMVDKTSKIGCETAQSE